MFPKFTTEILAVKIELLETNPNKSGYAELSGHRSDASHLRWWDVRCEMWDDDCSYVITDGSRLQLGCDFNVITGPDIERRGEAEAGEHNGLQLGYS